MFTAKVQRRTYRDVSDLALKLKGPTKVRVGFPSGTGTDIVARATYQEFGTRTIPERPFLRMTMRAERGNYQRMMAAGAREILHGGASMRSILSRLGILAQGDIQGTITSLQSPPNAPSTIRQKGSSNPLIWTGEMRQRVSFKVDD